MRDSIATVRGILARDPFIVFLTVAAGIFLLYWAVSVRQDQIVVTRSVQQSLIEDFELIAGYRPGAAERQKLVDDYVANEILFREAVARGMHLTDKTTKQRLIDRVRFLMTGAPDEPSEDVLLAYYASRPDLYHTEPQVTLTHVYYEKAPPADAPAILERLNAGDSVAGNDFPMGRDLPDYGVSMLRGMFGPQFVDAIARADTGSWIGPVRSIRGWHFVKVTGRGAARMLPYAEARDQVLRDYTAEQTGAAIKKEIDRLKQDVDVTVER